MTRRVIDPRYATVYDVRGAVEAAPTGLMIETRGELRMSDELDDVRARLAARREGCYDRIEDAVWELVEVHSEDGEQIVAFVRAALDRPPSSDA